LILARGAAATLLVLALAGCASGRRILTAPATTATSASATTTSTASTATTSTSEAVSTTTTEAGGPYATFTTPDAAVMTFVNAWLNRDSTTASHVATPVAVFSLFANPAPAGAPDFRGCNAGLGGMSTCIYRVGATSGLQIQLQDVPPTHWRVVEARFLS
jgi:hypothetical protein